MTLTITLSARGKKGVDFNQGLKDFFADFAPNGSPQFLGPNDDETTQIAHIATPDEGKESQARAVILDGEDFLYTFANHTVSGEIDTISLVRLGKAYDKETGQLVLEDGVITKATPWITIDDADIVNEPGVAGPVHEIVAGMMGGGPGGGLADGDPIIDVIRGEAHKLIGSKRGDVYSGTKFDDVIRGNGGDDVLKGRGGDDKITGGGGADTMTGNAGADTFIFTSARHTRGDLIRDFDVAEDDMIDVRRIDADRGERGNQKFDFIGTDKFSGDAGELRFTAGEARTVVRGDTDGDGSADFRIVLSGSVALTEDSFLL